MSIGFRARLDMGAARMILNAIFHEGEDALMAVALEGEAYAKRRMRRGRSKPGEFPGVDIGNLRAGIAAVEGNGYLHKRVISTASYGPHLEYGTRGRVVGTRRVGGMAARPFMRPTARHMAKVGPAMIAKRLQRAL